MRRWVAAAGVNLALLPASALAHGSKSDVRFEGDGLRPPIAGFEMVVAGGRITATSRSPHTLTVLDARGEPLYRLRPDGRTEQRTAIGWLAKSANGSVTWHDHRTGTLGRASIPVVDERGARSLLAGTVVPATVHERAPLWPVLLIVGAAGALALLTRRVLA